MKKVMVLGVVLLFIIFIFLIGYSIDYFQLNLLEANSLLKESTSKIDYHFIVIAQNTDDSYWQTVKEGCFDAAKDSNVAVEFNGPRFTNIDEQVKYFKMAVASRVDGIVTHVLDEEVFTPLIDEATDAGIPVITIEADAKDSKRKGFVGTNTYNLGSEAGKLVLESTGEEANIGIIIKSFNGTSENVPQSLRVAGFKDALKDAPLASIKTIQSSGTGLFSAEEVTRQILYNHPDVDTIICTTVKDTISAAQIIVDLNKVGEVTIIGYGDAPEILRYIEKGVIYGTVAANPYEMGYESIRSLLEYKKRQMTSSYVDTGAKVITSSNLEKYKTTLKEKPKESDRD
ncbi:MAG TPA: sugar ABC transporter substrate-binding protein [Clostridiaceae bacterium]|jgi:ribose transport system substrate-binding protein|nr:sugar ABC transporter substrate-binding protein [Clostridiaceae bacterium]